MAQGVRNLLRQGRDPQGTAHRFNFARMMRDVLVASIYRGQFPPALLGLIALAIILKMPSADMSELMYRLLDLMGRREGVGYLLAFLCAVSWFFHVRLQRRWIGEERRRLSIERAVIKAVTAGARRKSTEVHS